MKKPLAVALIAAVALQSALVVISSSPQRALACSGGFPSFEQLARDATLIAIGRATNVGGPVNAAPTLTPTATASPTPTADEDDATTPAESATPPPPIHSVDVDLTGLDATLEVQRTIVGSPPPRLELGRQARANAEREIRRIEAGGIGTSCEPDAFLPRYRPDAQYLVILPVYDQLDVPYPLRVEGGQVLLDDPLLFPGGGGTLTVSRAVHSRYFPGVPADLQYTGEDGDVVRITATRVPLANVLAAIDGIRRGGPQTIAPPTTGTAGLAANR